MFSQLLKLNHFKNLSKLGNLIIQNGPPILPGQLISGNESKEVKRLGRSGYYWVSCPFDGSKTVSNGCLKTPNLHK